MKDGVYYYQTEKSDRGQERPFSCSGLVMADAFVYIATRIFYRSFRVNNILIFKFFYLLLCRDAAQKSKELLEDLKNSLGIV